MAKYIIDIPEELAKASEEYWEKSTGMILVPYTEPGQKAIDLQHAHDIENVARMNYSKGAEDVWEFVRTVTDMTEAQRMQCFGSATCDLDEYYTYQEAKAKYEAWKKKEEDIRVGDEVVYHGNKYVVGYVGADEVYHIVDQNWIRVVVQGDYQIFKTGRHFNEVEELLKKMKEKL